MIYTRKGVDYGEYEKYEDASTPVRYRKNGELWQYTPSGGSRPGEARIMCAGDLMCEPAMSKAAFHNGKWFFEMCFAYVRSVFAKSDFAIANLETTVCTKAPYAIDKHKINGRYHCNAPTEFLDALRYAGLDAVAMANNHSADTGADGLLETLNHVDERGLMHTGAFADSSQRRYILADINGIKAAFFSYTEHINRDIDKEYFTEEGRRVMLNRYSLEKLRTDIAGAKENGAEFLICYIHFLSKEYTHEVTRHQEEKAAELAEAGIDCIIGGHSHALQRYDRIITKSGKTVPVLYSLGNFITSDNTSMITRTSIIYELVLRKDERGVSISEEKYIPCRVVENIGRSGFVIFPTPQGWRNGQRSDLLAGAEKEIQSVIGDKITIDDSNADKAADLPSKIDASKAASPASPQKDDSIFTKLAMYTGYWVDYFSSRFSTKEERICELKQVFYKNCGYYLNIDEPKTFNEKIQGLKVSYDNPLLKRCVDKAEFKTYIREQLGKGYTVPLYGVWENESLIDFDALPNTFVLKSTIQSDCRQIIVVKDKSTLDLDKLKTVLSSWLHPKNSLAVSYCNAYKGLRPRILAEEYVEGFDNQLVDYKFMCFNGKAEMLFAVADRNERMRINFYDLDWNLLPFTRKNIPNTDAPLERPKNFDRMLEIANKLAAPFPFVRVDFYESADGARIYVGELTFYPWGGYETFQPSEWDRRLGDMLRLPCDGERNDPPCLPCGDITLDPADPQNYKNLRTITLKKICSILGMDVPLQFREMQSEPIRYINARDKWIVKNSIYFSRYKYQTEIDWAREAYKRGARVLFTSKPISTASGTPLPCIVVEDPLKCFQKVNLWLLSLHQVKVVDITGSVGKTTTKDMIACVLSSLFQTLKSPGNSNSCAAVCNTIQRLRPEHEVYVQEVGAFAPGDVKVTTGLMHADACIVTNIGYPHVDLYGSIENILKDKMTIVENLREGGVAFLNYDDERIASYPVTKKVISFGIKNRSADYLAENIVNQDGQLSFDVVHDDRRVPVVLNMYGEHNVINALAAFAVGEWFGVPEDKIVKALYDFRSEGIRQSVYDIGGYHLYVDCYNSAPNSMIGSIKTLCGMDYGPDSRRIVFFGDIPRLGKLAPEIHQKVAAELKDFDVDLYICYGQNAKFAGDVLAQNGRKTLCAMEEDEFIRLIKENVRLNDTILIKAGHPMKITRALDKVFGTSFHFTDPDVLLEDTTGISKHSLPVTAFNVDGQAEIRSVKDGTKKLDIPKEIGGIPVARIGKEAFKGSGLTHVSLPGTLYNIGEGAFGSCEDLISIKLPEGLKIVERDAFNSCVSLKTIALPDGTSHLGAGAFYNCKLLERIVVPESVKMIEPDCFEGCSDALTLLCAPGSFAERYAKEHNIATKAFER